MSKKEIYDHLKMNDHWAKYFKQYAHGDTVIEQLVHWLSQVNNMVENINDWNDYLNDWSIYLDEFVETFDEKLKPHVIESLQEMYDSGDLKILIDVFINEKSSVIDEKLEGFTAQLAEKANKGEVSVSDINKNLGKFDQTYMSDEFLQQIAGNTPVNAVPADDSITLKKTTFYKTGKNLFNKATVSAVDKGLVVSTGELETYVGQQTSDFIKVEPNTSYRRTYRKDNDKNNPTDTQFKVCYYDVDKTFISGETPSPTGTPASVPIETPDNCLYIKTSWMTDKLTADDIQLEKGTVATEYEPYELMVAEKYVEGLKGNNILERVKSLEHGTIQDSGNIIKVVKNEIKNGNFVNKDYWTPIHSTTAVANNIMSVTGNGANKTPALQHSLARTNLANDTAYYKAEVRVTNADCKNITVSTAGGYVSRTLYNPNINEWYTIEGVGKPPADYTGAIIRISHEYETDITANGKTLEIKNVMLIDTSYDFGLGITPDMHLIKEIFNYNDLEYWEDEKELIIKNTITDINKNVNSVKEIAKQPKAYHEKRRPIVSFVNDDGWEADYYKLKGFSETYGIPFTSAIIANGSTLKQWQVLYLQNVLGWEIASHTTNNVVLSELATEEEIEYELKSSKEILISRGYDVKNLVYPQGESDERVRRIAKKYYNCAPTTNAGINTGVVPSFYLKRYPMGSFTSNTSVEYKAKVDECVASNGWLIFMLHPNNAQHTEQQQIYIEETIQYIQSLNVEIMTLDDGFKVFGNALEVGDYIGGTEGIAISKTGEKKNI